MAVWPPYFYIKIELSSQHLALIQVATCCLTSFSKVTYDSVGDS